MTKIEKMGEGWDSWKWTCNFCGLQKFGIYTRVGVHLLNLSGKGIVSCKKVRPEILFEMKKIEGEVAKRLSNLQPNQVPLCTSSVYLGPSLSIHEPRVLE